MAKGCKAFEPNPWRPTICRSCTKHIEEHGQGSFETQTYSSVDQESESNEEAQTLLSRTQKSVSPKVGERPGSGHVTISISPQGAAPPKRTLSPSLKLAQFTPSKISGTLKQELSMYIERRRARLLGVGLTEGVVAADPHTEARGSAGGPKGRQLRPTPLQVAEAAMGSSGVSSLSPRTGRAATDEDSALIRDRHRTRSIEKPGHRSPPSQVTPPAALHPAANHDDVAEADEPIVASSVSRNDNHNRSRSTASEAKAADEPPGVSPAVSNVEGQCHGEHVWPGPSGISEATLLTDGRHNQGVRDDRDGPSGGLRVVVQRVLAGAASARPDRATLQSYAEGTSALDHEVVAHAGTVAGPISTLLWGEVQDFFDIVKWKVLLRQTPIGVVDWLCIAYQLTLKASVPLCLCGWSFLLAMTTDLYPTPPASYNTAVALASAFVTLNTHEFGQAFFLGFFGLHVLSVLLDLNWLITSATDSQSMVRFKVVCIIFLVLNIILKLVICFLTLQRSASGSKVLFRVSTYGKLCIPRLDRVSTNGLMAEIYRRILSLAWMHFIGGLLYVVFLMIITFGFPEAYEFQQLSILRLPVSGILLMKSFTSIFVAAALGRNIVSCFGRRAYSLFRRSNEKPMSGLGDGPGVAHVIITGAWVRTAVLFKGVDLAVGSLLWGLFVRYYQPLLLVSQFTIRQLARAIFGVAVLLDVWTVVLSASVAWLVGLRRRHTRNLDGHGRPWRGLLDSAGGAGFDQEAAPVSVHEIHADVGEIEVPETCYNRLEFIETFRFTPQLFEEMWQTLPSAVSFECYVEVCPTVESLQRHLEERSFFVIAAGSTDGMSRIYACARGRGVNFDTEQISTFLMELSVDATRFTLSATLKCDTEGAMEGYLQELSLKDVVSNYQPIPSED